MKVGIMGGTFDPVHLGHLIAAERAAEGALLDEVWFMPANVPPHKEQQPAASPEHRLEMVRRAIAGHPDFHCIDIEIHRGGISYSIDTVLELQGRYPDRRFYYIIGADMVMYLPEWHRIDELVRHISFIGLQRPGCDLELSKLPVNIREKVNLVPMPMIEISSTEIRERKRNRRSILFAVPEAVDQYIEENGLYEA